MDTPDIATPSIAAVLLFAPLQGLTDAPYREAHARHAGGVEAYYMPFVRIERGAIRPKDERDLAHASASELCARTVPQLICRDADEMARLCDRIQAHGFDRIDLNLGCPFPLQTGAGRGAGLLPHPIRLRPILDEAARRLDCRFSAKLRLGMDSEADILALLPMLNESPLVQLVVHPRTARMQYRGEPLIEAFAAVVETCRKPLVYNGDIASPTQAHALLRRFPTLHGLMLGRGLLANPLLAQEIAGRSATDADRLEALLAIHADLYLFATTHLQGEAQQLQRLHDFWNYAPATLPPKPLKALRRCTSLRTYREALAVLTRLAR